MISFSGWQSVDIKFFKMFGSRLFKRFLIKTRNKKKRRLWLPEFHPITWSRYYSMLRGENDSKESDEFQATFMASV